MEYLPMKKTSRLFLFAGLILFLLGQIIHPVISWLVPEGGPSTLPEVVDEVSFSIALFGILNVLLGFFGGLASRLLDRFTKPGTFLLATGWSVCAAITVHNVLTLIDCFLSRPDRYPLRSPISIAGILVGLCGMIMLLRGYSSSREDDPYPGSVTLEFGFAIMYTLPVLVILISIDSLLCAL